MTCDSKDLSQNEMAAGVNQLAPNPLDMRAMIQWLCDGAPTASKIEIAHGYPDTGPKTARQFDVGDIDAAVAYAATQNVGGQNCYVGAALRKADTPQTKRASEEYFLAATAIRVDADTDAAIVREKVEAICDIGMIVTTGTKPELRQQFWTRLGRPCGDAAVYGEATKQYVTHVGGDKGAASAAGLMRLAGSISWPTIKKRERGYVAELVTLQIVVDAPRAEIDTFLALGTRLLPSSEDPGKADGLTPTKNPRQAKASENYDRQKQYPPVSPERLAGVLARIPNGDCAYDEWLAVLAGIHDASDGAAWGLGQALDWSARSFKDIPSETERRWRSLGNYSGKRATFASLVWRAETSDALKAAEEITRAARSMLSGSAPISDGDLADRFLRQELGINPVGDWPDCLRFRPGVEPALIGVAYDQQGNMMSLHAVDIFRRSATGAPVEGAAVRLPGTPEEQPLIATGLLSGIAIWAATGREVWVGVGQHHASRLDGTIFCREDAQRGKDPIRARVNQLRAEGIPALTVSPHRVRQHNGATFADLSPEAIRERIRATETRDAGLNLVSADAGRELMDRAVGDFFSPVGEVNVFGLPSSHRHAIRVPVGLGKTAAALSWSVTTLKRLRASGSRAIIVFAVPEHRLSDQIRDRFNDMTRQPGETLHAEVWRGMEAKRPSGNEPMCSNLDEVRKAQAVLANVSKEVCKVCAFQAWCPFLAQKNLVADLWVVAHAMLPYKPPETFADYELAALIIDESPVMAGLAKPAEMTLDLLDDGQLPLPTGDKTGDQSARLAINRGLLKQALLAVPEDSPLTAHALRAVGLDASSGEFGAWAEWKRKITEGTFEQRAPNRTIPILIGAWNEVRRLASDDEGSGVSGRLYVGRGTEGQRVLILRDKHEIDDHWRAVPTLFLDATLRPKLLAPYWSGISITANIAVAEPYTRIIQSVGASFGKSKLDVASATEGDDAAERKRNVEAVEIAISRLKRRNGYRSAVVISNKSIVDALTLPPGVLKAHFNAIAGHDEFGKVDAVFVIGRPMPGPSAVEAMAGALGGDHVPAIVESWYTRGDTERLLRTPEGILRLHDEADCHPNPWAEEVRQSIAVDQLLQAIGRGRGINRGPDNPVDVHMWSDVPLPVPVDAFVSADRILTPSVLEIQLARHGIAFQSPTNAAKTCPDLWLTEDAARRAMQRLQSVSKSGGGGHSHVLDTYVQMSATSPFRNALDPELVQINFQQAGAGHRPSTAFLERKAVRGAWQTIERLLQCELISCEVAKAEPNVETSMDADAALILLRVLAPSITEVARRIGISRSQLSNALKGRRSLSREAHNRTQEIIEARMRGFCFGTLIDLFRATPSIWPEEEDMPRQLATWRDFSQQEGPPPEPFAEIWAETRCRWDSHVALAAGF